MTYCELLSVNHGKEMDQRIMNAFCDEFDAMFKPYMPDVYIDEARDGFVVYEDGIILGDHDEIILNVGSIFFEFRLQKDRVLPYARVAFFQNKLYELLFLDKKFQ